MQIDIDFDTFKSLTLLRKNESHTYNDVIRELLGLETETGEERSNPLLGRFVGGRFLPNGTKLRARYKSIIYYGEIKRSQLIYDDKVFKSASAAARAVTDNNVNGLEFWEVKRPDDTSWKKLSALPRDRP